MRYNREAKEKTNLLYNAIDESDGFFSNHVHPEYRSRIAVPMRVAGGHEKLEKLFIKEAKDIAGIHNIAPHHSTGGGVRLCVYNAQQKDTVEYVASFMRDFQARYEGSLNMA